MGKFFDLDNPVMGALTKISDLVILNIVYLICCIPIVTIGAATTALYYVTLKMGEDRGSSTIRAFFRSFKQNFLQGTGIWMMFLLVGVVLGFDFYLVQMTGGEHANVMRIILLIPVVIFVMTLTFVFPLLARFDNTIRQTIKNAFLLSVSNLPKTLAMIISNILPIGVFFISVSLMPVSLLIGFAGVAYCNSLIFIKIFKIFEPEEEESRIDRIERELVGDKKKGSKGRR